MANRPLWSKLAIIAGGGDLPLSIARSCLDEGQDVFVVALSGWADGDGVAPFDHAWAGVGEIGKILSQCRANSCDAVTFAGIVKRPDFSALKVDWQGAKLLPKALIAARQGDDALLRVILGAFEKAGLTIVGAEQAAARLSAPEGVLGAVSPSQIHFSDIGKAMAVADALGAHDVGQGCVVCDGLVLALEAQEGTDAMLQRVAGLPEAIRGTPTSRAGVLVKRPKPIQDNRVDLPTIGVGTIERAAAAGLAGVAVIAGQALVIERHAVAARADALGLFVIGLTPQDVAAFEP